MIRSSLLVAIVYLLLAACGSAQPEQTATAPAAPDQWVPAVSSAGDQTSSGTLTFSPSSDVVDRAQPYEVFAELLDAQRAAAG
jgi:type IV pilus biogenesis protein CpaD/CtpE